ncbi:unnamed protein product [Rhodiola kirilowii]
MAMNVDYKSHEMYADTYNASFRELFISDLDPQCLHVNPMSYLGLSNTCYRYNMFCVPLSSSSFLSKEHDSRKAFLRSSDIGSIIKKKEENSLKSQKSDMINLDASQCSLPMLEINPHLLDWGHSYLHWPTLAFLSVTNRQKDNVLHVYKPFSTDPQFFACNYSGSLLDPGEVASICFVFHPKQLGMSSTKLVIQTSIGGFLVQGKGFAVIHPIKDETIEMPGIPYSGWWGKIMSLIYSLNMTVYAMEIKSSLPDSMRSLFKKILRWLSVKKIYVVSFLAVSLIFLNYCFAVPPLLQQIQKTHLFLGGNNLTPADSTLRKSPPMDLNQKPSGFSISYKMDVRHSLKKKNAPLLLDCFGNTEHSVVAAADSVFAAADSVVSQCAKSELVNLPGKSKKEELVTSPGTKSVVVLNGDSGDVTDIGTIAVKVGKEKRRKRKGKGPRAGVAASIESSGSQSGYSTPPSPLSPITTVLLPNKSALYAKMEKSKKSGSPIKTFTSHLCEKSVVLEASSHANDIEFSFPKKVATKETVSKHVMFPSATFPADGHSAQNLYPPYFLPPCSIPLHARAPGPELCKLSSYQAHEKIAVVKEKVINDFTYDIWGEHPFSLDLIGRLKEAPSIICPGNDSDSFSFFAKDPTLLQKFQPRYVSTTFNSEGK